MAPEKAQAQGDLVEKQDHSIKARKSQLFEERKDGAGVALKPFADYLRTTPAAPVAPGLKAALWARAVVVALLFVAALLSGRGSKRPTPRRAGGAPAVSPARLA